MGTSPSTVGGSSHRAAKRQRETRRARRSWQEAGLLDRGGDLVGGALQGPRSDSLPAAKEIVHSARRMRTGLSDPRDQVHLDAALGVPHGPVVERGEVEVGQELGVDPREQVLVERGRDAHRIVVGQQQLLFRLDQIGSQQERISRPQRAADLAQELLGRRRIEVADVGTEEDHEHRALRRAVARRVPQALLVGRAVAHDGDVVEAPERAFGELQGVGRDVDEMDTRCRRLRSASASIATFAAPERARRA